MVYGRKSYSPDDVNDDDERRRQGVDRLQAPLRRDRSFFGVDVRKNSPDIIAATSWHVSELPEVSMFASRQITSKYYFHSVVLFSNRHFPLTSQDWFLKFHKPVVDSSPQSALHVKRYCELMCVFNYIILQVQLKNLRYCLVYSDFLLEIREFWTSLSIIILCQGAFCMNNNAVLRKNS